MDMLKKALSDLVFNPTSMTMIATAITLVLVRRWFDFRNHRKARDEQIAALTPLAAGLGGRVIGPEGGDTTAWSAGVLGPVAEHVEGFFSKLFRRSKAQFDLALDFQRGDWHVRVTEASVRLANPFGYGLKWVQEHRIEVATARMAPLRMVRPKKNRHGGKPYSLADFEAQWNSWLDEPPLTAQNDHVEWQKVQLASPMDKEFFAYGSDPAAVARNLNFDAMHWLIDQENDLPLQAQSMRLTFELGVVYIVMDHHIDQDSLMVVVDTICGLLDRMPGARPRHPAAAV